MRPVFIWEVGSPKDIEALIEAVRYLMDKSKERRDPGDEAIIEFPASLSGLVLKLPPKPSRK